MFCPVLCATLPLNPQQHFPGSVKGGLDEVAIEENRTYPADMKETAIS